jgi:signal transduction histidine kinase
MSSNDQDRARLQRLLDACRRSLNHDLPNQLVAMHGLLQLLQLEEADRLSPGGQDYLKRLLAVAQRIQSLARTLKELARLSGDLPAASVVALPELVEEVLAHWPAPLDCTFAWDAPRVLAPRPLLQQALAQALRLLLESRNGVPTHINLVSRPAPAGVELSLQVGSTAPPPRQATPPASLAAALPGVWHERVECVLIRELIEGWGGVVKWDKDGDQLRVSFTLASPR